MPLKAHEDTYLPITDALTTTTAGPSDAPVEQKEQVQVAPASSQCCSCSYGAPGLSIFKDINWIIEKNFIVF